MPLDDSAESASATAAIEQLRICDKMPAATLLKTESNASPFKIHERDIEVLAQSEGFSILRDHLADHYPSELCAPHSESSSLPAELHVLNRDILHALLVPVVELFDEATSLAFSASHASKVEQLEHCFTGQARSAFVWLQCYLSSAQEVDWCYTKGCPACVGQHSLDSEFSIRLLFAACLLSDVHYPFTLEGPTLPSFRFFLDELEQALERDEQYGAGFFERMQPKALATRNGIEDLIYQSIEWDRHLSQPSSPSGPSSPVVSVPPSPVLGAMGTSNSGPEGKGLKVKKSKLAMRQKKVKIEDGAWMEKMLDRCWDQLEPEQKSEVVPSRSLDAVLKEGTEVSTREVEADG